MGNLHENLRTFSWIILRTQNVSDKFVEKIKTHNLCSIIFLQNLCHLWDNEGKCCRTREAIDDNTKHSPCSVHGCTHSEYVIFISFPCLQWLINCASMLCYSILFNHIVKSEDDSKIWDIVWYVQGASVNRAILKTPWTVNALIYLGLTHMNTMFI
jgi:hypothetical protein